jgi:MoaD family protein
MNIEVRFFGGVSQATGNVEKTKIDFEGTTLGDLLHDIMSTWPDTKDFIEGAHSSTIVLALNEKALEPPDMEMELHDGDKLAIMPLVAGG